MRNRPAESETLFAVSHRAGHQCLAPPQAAGRSRRARHVCRYAALPLSASLVAARAELSVVVTVGRSCGSGVDIGDQGRGGYPSDGYASAFGSVGARRGRGVVAVLCAARVAGTVEVIDIPGCVPSEATGGCKYERELAARFVLYVAGVGERNVVTLSALGDPADGDEQFRISDAGAPVIAGAGCESVHAGTAICALRSLAPGYPGRFPPRLFLGDLDDSLVGGPQTYVFAHAGPGADVLRAGIYGSEQIGGPGDDAIFGGRGTDRLWGDEGDDAIAAGGDSDYIGGGPGRDLVDGGSGADRLFGSDGSGDGVGDQLDGGNGEDRVEYYRPGGKQGVRVDLRSGIGGSGKAMDRLRSIEDATGTRGPDVLIGNARDNRLDGDRGLDRVEANGGDDEVVNAETVSCGAGADRVESPSPRFALPRDCELVKPDVFGPELLIRTYPLRLSGGQLAFRIPCLARGRRPCIMRVTLQALSSAQAGNVGERLGTSAPTAVPPGTSRSVVVRLTATAQARLARARTPLRVTLAQRQFRQPPYAITLGG